MSVRVVVTCLLAGMVIAATAQAAEPIRRFYVSPKGNDAWTGRLEVNRAGTTDGPFATLERARDAIRALKTSEALDAPIEVFILPGVHTRTTSLELSGADSGTPDAPIRWVGAPALQSRLVGGSVFRGGDSVSDPGILARLSRPAREKVRFIAAHTLCPEDRLGELRPRGFGRPIQPAALELFANGKAMQLARWPNDGYVQIAAVPDGPDSGKFQYDGDRPRNWRNIEDVWIHGYWTWDWAESYERIKHIDVETRTIETYPPHGVYGYKEGKRYYVLNVLEELDQPGEWYLDRQSGVLYFWPLSDPHQNDHIASVLEAPFITVSNGAYIEFQGLSFECGRAEGVVIQGGNDIVIENCRFANLGTYAVGIAGGDGAAPGTRIGVRHCEIYGTGEGGIMLDGGDRKTLTPAGNFAIANRIHDFSRWVYTYRPGISLSGVGNIVAHNEIYDAPHSAIIFHGNEHAIEYNHIHHVCMDTHDAGAVYVGRDWTQRGNRIQFNYLHDLGSGDVNAVYLDDWTSGTIVYGNVCIKAGRGVLLGGGRDNLIENNIFIDCRPSVHIDARGLGWAKNYFDGTTPTLFERFEAMNATQPPYSEKYPELKTLLQDEPAIPKGNRVLNNISSGGRWLDLLDGMNDTVITFANNVTEGDPGFEDRDKGILKPDAAVYTSGFKPIPYERFGPKGYRPNP